MNTCGHSLSIVSSEKINNSESVLAMNWRVELFAHESTQPTKLTSEEASIHSWKLILRGPMWTHHALAAKGIAPEIGVK